MTYRDWPGRRYPPTPYPPRSEATRDYRDGWDEGWDHLAKRSGEFVLTHERGLRGPRRHGYRDGVIARLAYEKAHREGDLEWRRRDREEERRRWAQEDPDSR